MPDTRPPAELLHAAATHLRELAAAASTDTDGTPTAHWNTEPTRTGSDLHILFGDHLTRDDGSRIPWPPLIHGGRLSYMHAQHATYAAAMGPAVGLAIAAWLESAARDARLVGADPQAVAVARAILGGDDQ